jgi:hypothetical protein
VSRPTRRLTDDQIRIGATAGIAHVAIAPAAHYAVPVSLAPRLGMVADPTCCWASADWSLGNSTATTRPHGRPDSNPRSHNDARQCTVAVT